MKIEITKLECKRCGHKWIPKQEEVRQCPKCKSAWWNEEKIKQTKKGTELDGGEE